MRFLVVFTFIFLTAAASAQTSDAIRVLTDEDRERYAEIFELQEEGAWTSADKLINAVDDDILMGHVWFQRYMHPTAYRSSYQELKQWMAYYADHPQADRIYKLANKKRPRQSSSQKRPIPRKWRAEASTSLHPDTAADYERTSTSKLRQIEGRVRFLSRKERALDALKEIDGHKKRGTITTRQYDRMRSWIAASLYYQGYVDTAEKLASASAKRNGDTGVLAYWIAGLIDFRNDDAHAAFEHFVAMAAVPYQDDALRSAAGFWAARSALKSGNLSSVAPNLEIAAQFPFTFYGQLAIAQLGREHQYQWTPPAARQGDIDALIAEDDRIKRAIALAEIGRKTDADLELRWANGFRSAEDDPAMLAIAMAHDLPSAQLDIALAGGKPYEAGLYPIPAFTPLGGFKTDRALIYALMRQESKFKTDATSRVGARGLMQLMPRTASYMAKDNSLRSASGRKKLYDPSFNLALGQRYVKYLIDNSANGNLFHMAAAYNGGPGNLRKWRKEVDIEDPLLFIESIPNPESRDFVEKVLTNIWVYRARLGQAAPTRDKVAAGELPLYEAIDQRASQ
ncbi:MAG: lytic transglycosylase domain-containing protein [Pseudomonadota bacterium]